MKDIKKQVKDRQNELDKKQNELNELKKTKTFIM